MQSADENLNFEEQILEAAKNIAGATSALVKSATAAQRELVAQGKLSSNPQSEDGQWSEGLVSAVSHTTIQYNIMHMHFAYYMVHGGGIIFCPPPLKKMF